MAIRLAVEVRDNDLESILKWLDEQKHLNAHDIEMLLQCALDWIRRLNRYNYLTLSKADSVRLTTEAGVELFERFACTPESHRLGCDSHSVSDIPRSSEQQPVTGLHP